MSPKPPFPARAKSPCVIALVIAASLCGCATELDNPELYQNPFGGSAGTGGGGSSNGGGGNSNAGTGGTTAAACDAPTLVFQVEGTEGGCNGAACHIPGGSFPPDLISANPALRLVDVPSTGTFCSGQLLIDSSNVDNSLILKKIAPNPTCGAQMPFGLTALSDEKAQCIRDWVQSVIAP